MESRIEHYSMRRIVVAVSLALPALAVQAQEPTTELAPVVVTATAAELAIKDAPASMSVITAEEIKKLPAADLNEVLRRVPGLSQGTSPDGGTSIQIRGLPQQYTMILIDGRRTGSSSDTFDRYTRNELNWIPVEMIERIEVVRGPMSSLYGSDAMGGVINIITKKTGTKWGGTVSAGAEYNPDSIRGNDYNGGFSIAGPLADNLRLRVNGQQTYRQADSGLPAGTTAFRWGGGREGSKIQSYGANLDWDINDNHRLSFDYQHGEWRTLGAPTGDTSNPGGFTAAASTRGPARMERDSVGLNYTGKHSIGTSKVSLQHIEYKNDTTAPRVSNGQLVTPLETYRTHAVAKDLILDGSLSMPLTLGFEQMLTVGAQWQKNELDNPNSVGSLPNADGQAGLSYKKTNSYALFAEDQIYLRDNLNLTLGLRADHHDDFGSHLSPRAYLVYHPTSEWTVRGGYSEGFKAPSLRQSNPNFVSQSRGAGCLPGATAGTGCYTRGNADLKPETTENWEVGFGWERQSWQAGMTFFNTDFKNKLHQRGLGYLPGSTVYWQEFINIASAVTRGIEGNVRVPLVEKSSLPALQSLMWTTNVTHMMKAENKGTGEPLTSVPEWTATASLDWQLTRDLGVTFLAEFIGKQVNLDWRVANNANSFGDQRIQNSYTIYDLGVNYQINKQLRLNAGIKNLFDHDATGNSDTGNNFYIPGRRYFATLTASF